MITATISAPPVLPPALNAKAIATPIQSPAATAANILEVSPPGKISFNVGNSFSMIKRNTDCVAMLKTDKMANRRFTKKNAMITRGKLMQKDIMLCGTFPLDATLIKMEMPAAPPMVKSLGVMRLYDANAISNEESNINKTERIHE